MAIVFICKQCGQELSAPERLGGKKVRCPKCKLVVQVPAVAAGAAPPPEAARQRAAPAPPAAAPAQTVVPPRSAGPSGEFMTCPGCGNEIRRDATTCFFCGRATRPPAPPAPPPEPAPAAPAPPKEKKRLWQRLRRKQTPAPGAPPVAPSGPPVAAPAPTVEPAVVPSVAEAAPGPAPAPPADAAAALAGLAPGPQATPSAPDAFAPLRRTLHTANLLATVWLGVIVLAGVGGAVAGLMAGKMMGLAVGLGAAVLAGTFVTLQWFLIRSFTGLVRVLLETERNTRKAAEPEPSPGVDETLARLEAIETESKRLTGLEARLADIARHTANLDRLDEIGDHLRFVLERLREGASSAPGPQAPAPSDPSEPTEPGEAGQTPGPEA